MKRSMFTLAVLAAATGFYASPLRADDKPASGATQEANVSAQKGKPGNSDTIAILDQAARLVSYARDNESPTAMLAAVQMIERVPVRENDERVGAKKSETDPNAPKAPAASDKKGNTPAPTFDTQKLLAEARGWAKGDTNLLALIDAEMAKAKAGHSGSLGAVGGPSVHRDSVNAGGFDQYTVRFIGGEVAAVGVDGDDDTDLDLYVYDDHGNLIAKDDDYTDHCLVRWVPRYTGDFTIRVYNRGAVYNNYVIGTN